MTAPTNKIALITGASSGIGAAFARQLAAEQYEVILVARRKERLTRLATELHQQFHVDVQPLLVDLSNATEVKELAQGTTKHGAIDLLVNNAGFGIPGMFAEVPLERQLAMIQVHVLASVQLAHAVLPGMLARGRGAIINVASIGAFFPKPKDVTYCATKAYLKTFSEALHAELKGTGVQVQALCPGFTSTEFLDHPAYEQMQIQTRIPKGLWMSAEEVVAASLQALRRGDAVCIPGFRNRLMVALARCGLMPLLLKGLERRPDP